MWDCLVITVISLKNKQAYKIFFLKLKNRDSCYGLLILLTIEGAAEKVMEQHILDTNAAKQLS